MNMRSVIGAFLGVAAIAILVFLYLQTRSVSSAQFTQTVGNIRELQRLDADRTIEVVRVQLGLSFDFDQLSQSFQEIRRLKNLLKNSSLADPQATSQAIYDQLNKYLDLLQEKERAVDLFKRLHGPLKNSIRFLPNAGSEWVAKSNRDNQRELAREVEMALKDVFLYIASPEPGRKESLNQWLSTNFMQYPPEVASAAGNFVPHANLILNQKEPANEALANVLSMPTGLEASDLIDLYTLFHGAELAKVEKYRLAMVVFAGLLLMVSLVIGIRLVKAQGVVKVAEALKEANQNLESKVEARTHELSTAYDQLKGSQAQLVQSGKMAAVGQLVAGVAHEINTPLGYVSGNVEIFEELLGQFETLVAAVVKLDEMLKRADADGDEIEAQFSKVNQLLSPFVEDNVLGDAKELVTDSQFGLNQISEIVLSLKGFSRVDATSSATVNVIEGIENTLKVSQNLIKKTAKVVKNYEDIPNIPCNLSQLNQVFLNLITNSIHAIEASGRSGILWIKAKASSNYVQISIQDNGVGMTPEVQKHLFEPFYTTKDVGLGTGLGLAISQKIITDHGGFLHFKSVPGKGTVFQISLPIKKQPKSLPSATRRAIAN